MVRYSRQSLLGFFPFLESMLVQFISIHHLLFQLADLVKLCQLSGYTINILSGLIHPTLECFTKTNLYRHWL